MEFSVESEAYTSFYLLRLLIFRDCLGCHLRCSWSIRGLVETNDRELMTIARGPTVWMRLRSAVSTGHLLAPYSKILVLTFLSLILEEHSRDHRLAWILIVINPNLTKCFLKLPGSDCFVYLQSLPGEQLLPNILKVSVGATIAFAMEVSEFLVVTYTSSLTLSIAGIFKVK